MLQLCLDSISTNPLSPLTTDSSRSTGSGNSTDVFGDIREYDRLIGRRLRGPAHQEERQHQVTLQALEGRDLAAATQGKYQVKCCAALELVVCCGFVVGPEYLRQPYLLCAL